MHTFAQKPKATKPTTSTKSTIPTRCRLGKRPEVRSILHLHRTIGNQVVQRMLQADAQEPEAGLIGPVLPCFGHDFSRIPKNSFSAGAIQTKLAINKPGDEYEQEADGVAEQVMRMSERTLQRACPCGGGCPKCQNQQDEQALIQTKPTQGLNFSEATSSVEKVISSPGQPLDSVTRAFFEPRFGHDFSKVRMHTDSVSSQSARNINALAYTFGNHIAFGRDKYQPQTSTGRALIAHELTHVLQQNNSNDATKPIQRTVAATSSCTAGTHNAPADPLAELRNVDSLAQDMALRASQLLFLESLGLNHPTFGRSPVFDAYRNNFGTPEQTSTGAWRSRFRIAAFATEEEAMAHEMQVLSDRFLRIHNWLAGDIRYRCPGTASFTIPGCAARPCRTSTALTCPTGSRTIAICPNFWVWPAPRDRGQASDLIHEAIHPLFHFAPHSTASVVGRGRNPGCYAGFVLDVFNTRLRPNDCPAI